MKELDWKAEALTEALKADEPRRIAEPIVIYRHKGFGMGRRTEGNTIRSRGGGRRIARGEERRKRTGFGCQGPKGRKDLRSPGL